MFSVSAAGSSEFASFNENAGANDSVFFSNDQSRLLGRTFEQLICDRDHLNLRTNLTSNIDNPKDYDMLFQKLMENINNTSIIEEKANDAINEQKLQEYSEKYKLVDKLNFCNDIKKTFVELAQKKNSIHEKLEDAYTRYNNFVIPLRNFTAQLATIDDAIELPNLITQKLDKLKEQLQIEEQQREYDEIYKEYQWFADTFREHVNIVKDRKACPICYTNEVEFFCDPCGHTYCSNCNVGRKCPTCRANINKMCKLYYN